VLLPLVEPPGICDVSEEGESEAPVFVLLDGAPGDLPILARGDVDEPIFEELLEGELDAPEAELLTPSCSAVSESSRPVTFKFFDC
jgi:hypothetical protein